MRLVVLVLALLAVPAAAARADALTWGGPPGTAPSLPLPKVTREVSYSHQTLILDGIAGALVVGAFFQDDPYASILLVSLGAQVYLLGPPIVHFANRQVGNGFKSAALRVGLPMLGAIAGGMLGPKDAVACDVGSSCPDPEESTVGLLVGLGFGALAAVIVDARYIARKRVVVSAPSFAPTVGYNRTGFTVGLGGSF